MKTIKDYIQGEHFVYGKKNCMVLEHMDDGFIVPGEVFRWKMLDEPLNMRLY